MYFRYLIGIVATSFIIASGAPSTAQTFDPTLSDPDDIAQECGGDAARGATLWGQCAACHALEFEAASRAGPNLNGIYGAPAGTREGYEYSDHVIEAGFDGFVWEPERMHAFLTDPQAVIPGIGGTHEPIGIDQDRRDLMTYLRTHSLPPAPDAADVVVPEAVWQIGADASYGEYLAGDCMSCHTEQAADAQGLKPLGQDGARAFVRAMFEYRARARSHDVMQMVAQSLGDEEIVSLAAYFAALNEI